MTVLERILPALHRRGYRIVTVSELAAAGQMPGVDNAQSGTDRTSQGVLTPFISNDGGGFNGATDS